MKNKGVINNTGTIYGTIHNHNGGKINNNSGGLFTGVRILNWPCSELNNYGLILFVKPHWETGSCPEFDGYNISNCSNGYIQNVGGEINNYSSGIIDSKNGGIHNGGGDEEGEPYYNNDDDYIDGEHRNSVINNFGTISNTYTPGGGSQIWNFEYKGIINNKSGGKIYNEGDSSSGGIINEGSIVNCGTISGYEIDLPPVDLPPEDCP